MDIKFKDEFEKLVDAIPNLYYLKEKTIFITGSTGLIGRYLISFLIYLNYTFNYNVTVVANARSFNSIRKTFDELVSSKYFRMSVGDINAPLKYWGNIDYIINCASNTHPMQYSTDPIGTIMTNVLGTRNILELACSSQAKKVLFLSSVEIYGENKYGVEKFKEQDMGYIDCNTLRACYNEAKRTGETLCQAYIESKGIDVSVVRLPRIYGPTVKKDDSKVLSQFINKAIKGEDIVLKSEGKQYFSYLYVADAISGMLTVLLNGVKGEAYNLGNIESDIHLKDLAELVASIAGTKVVFDLPSEVEKKGFSKAVDARLDYTKIIDKLGWKPLFSIEEGLRKTIDFLKY